MTKRLWATVAILVLMWGVSRAAAQITEEGGSRVISMNQNWKFFRVDDPKSPMGDALPDDAKWDKVNLPHTVRLEPLAAAGGENFQGVCWYSRHFTPDTTWKDRVLYLRFEGAMQVADVWLNGQKLTTHFGGYQPFTIDIGKAVQFGKENVLMVRLDNSDNREVPPGKPQNQLDFTYFGGLYRDVDLYVLDKLHITDEILANKVAGGGVFVSYPNVSADSATVQVQTEVQNEFPDARKATVTEALEDPSGTVVASASTDLQLAPQTTAIATQQLTVKNPKLWHPNHPNLYTLVTRIKDGDRDADYTHHPHRSSQDRIHP